jgi:hypothetical protein
MNLVKHLGIKCILIMVILLTNFYVDSYLSKPFTYTDLIAIIIVIPILIFSFTFYDKLKKRLKPMSSFKDISISVIAIFFAIIFTGILTGELQV